MTGTNASHNRSDFPGNFLVSSTALSSKRGVRRKSGTYPLGSKLVATASGRRGAAHSCRSMLLWLKVIMPHARIRW